MRGCLHIQKCMCIRLPPVVTGGAAVGLCNDKRERLRWSYSTRRARIDRILFYYYIIRCQYRSKESEVAPTTSHLVGSSGIGLIPIIKSSTSFSKVITKSMSPAVHSLSVVAIVVSIGVAAVVDIVDVAVVFAIFLVVVVVAIVVAIVFVDAIFALIILVAIVVVVVELVAVAVAKRVVVVIKIFEVLIPTTPLLLVVATVSIRVTSTIFVVHRLHSFHHSLHLLE